MAEESNKDKKKRLKAERKAKALAKQNQAQPAEKPAKKAKKVKETKPEKAPSLLRVFSAQTGEMANWINNGVWRSERTEVDGTVTKMPKLFYAAEELQPLLKSVNKFRNMGQYITQRESFIHGLQWQNSDLMTEMMHFGFWNRFFAKKDEYKALEERMRKNRMLIWKSEHEIKEQQLAILRLVFEMQDHHYNL